jgi:hypothetical protein
MEQDLKLKGVSPATTCSTAVSSPPFFIRSPEELGAAEVRAFLLHAVILVRLIVVGGGLRKAF